MLAFHGTAKVARKWIGIKRGSCLSIIFLLFFAHVQVAQAFTASVSWDANTEADLAGYKLHYGTAPGSYGTTIDVGNQTSTTVSGLSAGTYYFALTAYDTSMNESGYSAEFPKTFSAADTSPPIPSGMAAISISSTGVTIIWNTDEPASSRVDYSVDTSYATSSPNNTTLSMTHSHVLSGLSPSTTYNYRVVSADAAGNSGPSANLSFTTAAVLDQTAPTLSSVSLASVSSNGAVISWSTDENADARLEYSIDTSYSAVSQSATMSTSHSLVLSNLLPSTNYNYRVISTDAAGNASLPTTGSFITSSGAGSELLISNLTVVNGKLYQLLQNGAANGLSAYIDRSYTYSALPLWLQGAASVKTANSDKTSQQASFFLSFDVNQNVTVYIAYDDRYPLKPLWLQDFTDTGENISVGSVSMSLFKKVYLSGTVALGGNVNPGGTGDNNMYTVFVIAGGTDISDTTAPLTSNIRAQNITDSEASIAWNTDEPASSRVEYGLSTGYGQLSQTNPNLSVGHSHLLSNLTPSTLYHYRVISTDALGNEDRSGDLSFTTAPSPEPVAPPGGGEGLGIQPPDAILSFSAIENNGYIQLSWENPLDVRFAGVRIVYRRDRLPKGIDDGEILGDFPGNPGKEMLLRHGNIVNGVTYYYLAASYNHQGLFTDGQGNLRARTAASSKTGAGDSTGQGNGAAPSGTGCGMIRPGGGAPPGPGQAASMLTLLGLFALIWLKKGLRQMGFSRPARL